jgi:hypothetical protein
LAIVLITLLVALSSACSRDTLPIPVGPADPGQVPDKSVDTFTNVDTPEQTVVLEMISRTRYLKRDHYRPGENLSRPEEGIFMLQRLTSEAPALSVA